jgi:uncharacterized protein
MRATRRRRRSGNGASLGTLLLGFVLAVGGGYLLTTQVQVGAGPFGGFAWFGPTSFGLLLIPLLLGVGLLCFNTKLLIGRLLVAAGAVILLASVLNTLRITFLPTSLFNTLLMLGLLVAGLGLMARSIVGVSATDDDEGYRLDLQEVNRQPQIALSPKHVLPQPTPKAAIAAPGKSIDEELATMRTKKSPNTVTN